MSGIEELKESFCTDLNLFKRLRDEFPKAPVRLLIRNFSDPNSIRVIELMIPEAPDGRVHVNNVTLTDIFPQLAGWVDQNKERMVIPCERFIQQGDQLARMIGRELTILHQFGSGDPLQANFKEYGPYLP